VNIDRSSPENTGVTPKRASIKDVARLANVSHSTVSRALRGSPLVKRRTAELIQRIADERGYCVSAVARSLVTSKTNTIGVVVTTISDPFVAEVVAGIEDVANEREYSVFLANSNADPDREMRVVRQFEERRVDGIVVTSSRVGALYMPMLTRMGVPIVLLNNQHPTGFAHSVMIDNLDASRQLVRYLIELGHRRIAYIGDRFGRQSDTERFGGYRAALDETDISFQPDLVAHGNGKPEGGEDGMRALLALGEPPTAVFCYNDMTALGALRTARGMGLSVPGDVSLAGFDDIQLAGYFDPPLTTVRQPTRQMGRLAMETLLALFADPAPEHNIRLRGELIVRQSTAPPKVAHLTAR